MGTKTSKASPIDTLMDTTRKLTTKERSLWKAHFGKASKKASTSKKTSLEPAEPASLESLNQSKSVSDLESVTGDSDYKARYIGLKACYKVGDVLRVDLGVGVDGTNNMAQFEVLKVDANGAITHAAIMSGVDYNGTAPFPTERASGTGAGRRHLERETDKKRILERRRLEHERMEMYDGETQGETKTDAQTRSMSCAESDPNSGYTAEISRAAFNATNAIDDTVKRAASAHREENDNLGELVQEKTIDAVIDLTAEFTKDIVKDAAKHMLEHAPALGWSAASVGAAGAAGGVALAAAGPLAITLVVFGVLKVGGGVILDHYGNKWCGSHKKWWSKFGETLLGDQRVTRLMVAAMQAESGSSMITELGLALCSMESKPNARRLAQQGVLDNNYQAFQHLNKARDKAITYLHNGENGELMTYIMAARVIMVFNCLCDRRALHSKAIIIFGKLMNKTKVKSLIKSSKSKSSKDDMAPLGELILFVQTTDAFIGMYGVDVEIPDYEVYHRRPALRCDGAQ